MGLGARSSVGPEQSVGPEPILVITSPPRAGAHERE
jgi:hypothetical protein